MSDGTPTIGVLFTDGLPVFQWKAIDIRWSLVDSIGQPSIFSSYCIIESLNCCCLLFDFIIFHLARLGA